MKMLFLKLKFFIFIFLLMTSFILFIFDCFNKDIQLLEDESMPKGFMSKEKYYFEEFLKNSKNRTKHLKRPNLTIAETEQFLFEFSRITCGPMKRIYGSRNVFHLCMPKQNALNSEKSLYIIGGQRDKIFESNFKKNFGRILKIKVFTKIKNKNSKFDPNEYAKPADVFQNIHVKNFVQNFTQNLSIGIKDLVDLQNDKFELDIEALKCEMKNKTNPLIFTALITEVAHLLLRVDGFNYKEMHYLIKRLNSAAYYPYSIQHRNGTYFFSFLNKYAFINYNVEKTWKARWKKN